MAPKKKAGGKADKKPAKEHKEDKGDKHEHKDPAVDPASIDFEAGLLFNKADSSRTGVITADDFRKLWHDIKVGAAGTPAPSQSVSASSSASSLHPAVQPPLRGGLDPEALSFEAGKIFSLFDHDHDGRLDKTDFEALIKSHPELTRAIPGLAELQQQRASAPSSGPVPTEVISGRMLTHFDETAGVAIPRTSVEEHRKMGNTVTPLIESYRARYDRLRALLTSKLLPKREHLLQIRRSLQNTSLEVHAKKGSIEKETITDGEEIVERLRAVESMRQSNIKHQMLKVESDLEGIERIVRRVETANDDGLYQAATGVLLTSAAPGQTPVESVRAPRAASMVELIQQFADLSNHIETLSAKEIQVQVDFPVDDFPRETAERLEVLARCDKYQHALQVKDHMLWTALQEKEKAEEMLAEERNLSREYAQEVSEWAEMAQKLSQENFALKQEREKSDRRTRDILAKMRENGLYYESSSVANE
jgi:hypothetical protein